MDNQRDIELPSFNELKSLENLSRREGTGITVDSLEGSWNFESVYKQDKNKEDKLTGAILRLISAKLYLRKHSANEDKVDFIIRNSIQFSKFHLEFTGFGWLKGKQPMLTFFFESIRISLGRVKLFQTSIKKPSETNMPFFSFIAIGSSCQWIAARGRGGGVALWLKDFSI